VICIFPYVNFIINKYNILTHLMYLTHNNLICLCCQFLTSISVAEYIPGYIIVKTFWCYKPDCRFDSRWGQWIFQLTKSFQPQYGPGVNLASNRNDLFGVKDGQHIRLTTSPPSVSWLSRTMWEPWRLIILWTSTACYRDSFTFTFSISLYISKF
jgi:hypothetical protein